MSVKKRVPLGPWCPQNYFFWISFSFVFLAIFEISGSSRMFLANVLFPLVNNISEGGFPEWNESNFVLSANKYLGLMISMSPIMFVTFYRCMQDKWFYLFKPMMERGGVKNVVLIVTFVTLLTGFVSFSLFFGEVSVDKPVGIRGLMHKSIFPFTLVASVVLCMFIHFIVIDIYLVFKWKEIKNDGQ